MTNNDELSRDGAFHVRTIRNQHHRGGLGMSEAKFTPGPWRVEHGTTAVWGRCNPDDMTTYGMGYPITLFSTTPMNSWAKGPNVDEAIANAHLSAAAPDMYEALEEAANSAGFQYMMYETRNLIEAALAKARGEQ